MLQLIRNATAMLVITAFISASAQAQQANNATNNESTNAETRYVSDKLITYLHSGPGRNFRILGSIEAGTPVTQLNTQAENNFVHVIDDKNRTGWLDARHVVSQETVHVRLPVLQQQLSFSGEQLISKQSQIEQLTNQIADMDIKGKALNTEITQLKQTITELNSNLSSNKGAEKREWFMLGGGVGLGGVLLGVILSLLLKSRRRDDKWM